MSIVMYSPPLGDISVNQTNKNTLDTVNLSQKSKNVKVNHIILVYCSISVDGATLC